MYFNNFKSNKGFTLIEILVVIAIIGVLSAVVLPSLNEARIKARNVMRKNDLNQIRTALFLYYDIYGHYMYLGSGCGNNGDGRGWFSYGNGTTYPVSMSQCLVNAGVLPEEIVDPSGARSGSLPTNNIYTYMKYNCSPTKAQIFARLEGIPPSDTAVDGSCSPTLDTSYGMNYFITVE